MQTGELGHVGGFLSIPVAIPVAVPVAIPVAGQEAGEGALGVASDALRVADDVRDGDAGQHDPHRGAEHDAVAERDARGGRGDARREGVHRRAEHSDARAENDHADRGHAVVPEGEHQRHDQTVEAERLLGEALDRAEQREHHHDTRDEQRPALAQPVREPSDAAVERAGREDDGDERADGEDEEDDTGTAVQRAGVVGRDQRGLVVLNAVEPVDG